MIETISFWNEKDSGVCKSLDIKTLLFINSICLKDDKNAIKALPSISSFLSDSIRH